MSEELNLHGTTDAAVWAKEFCRLFPDADEGLMLGWFANAIMTGVDSVPNAPTWQDIGTAPKDGTKVLLYCAKASKQTKSRQGMQAVDYWHTVKNDGFQGWGKFNKTYFPANHWMPLPEPPQSGENCRKCSGQMKPSQALAPSLAATSSSDLIADTIHTVNSTGLTDCLKCEDCGWSVTAEKGTE